MLTIVAGVPAVGKSRACAKLAPMEFDEWVRTRYALDDVEEATELFRKEYPESNDAYLNDVAKACIHGDVVLVDTFAYRDDRMKALAFLRAHGVSKIMMIYLVASWRTIEARNLARGRPRSEGTVMKLFFDQEFPSVAEGFDSVEILSNE